MREPIDARRLEGDMILVNRPKPLTKERSTTPMILLAVAVVAAATSFICAGKLHAQSQAAQQRLNDVARQVDRVEERLSGQQTVHRNDVAALRLSLEDHSAAIAVRLETIERYLFWLFGVTGGVGTAVGGDIAIRIRKKATA